MAQHDFTDWARMVLAGGAVALALLFFYSLRLTYQMASGDAVEISRIIWDEMQPRWAPPFEAGDVRGQIDSEAHRVCDWHEVLLQSAFTCSVVAVSLYEDDLAAWEKVSPTLRRLICERREDLPWDIVGHCIDGLYQGRVFLKVDFYERGLDADRQRRLAFKRHYWLGGP